MLQNLYQFANPFSFQIVYCILNINMQGMDQELDQVKNSTQNCFLNYNALLCNVNLDGTICCHALIL